MKEIIKTIGATIAVGAAMVLFVGMAIEAADTSYITKLGEDGTIREYYKFRDNGTPEKDTKSYNSYKKSVISVFGEEFFNDLEKGYEAEPEESEIEYELNYRTPEFCLSLGGAE